MSLPSINFLHLMVSEIRFICCFTSRSTARVILRQVVLQVEEQVHTSWSRFCTVNYRESASTCQLSNMKRPAQDSNLRPQRLEASTLTATPPSPHMVSEIQPRQTSFSHHPPIRTPWVKTIPRQPLRVKKRTKLDIKNLSVK